MFACLEAMLYEVLHFTILQTSLFDCEVVDARSTRPLDSALPPQCPTRQCFIPVSGKGNMSLHVFAIISPICYFDGSTDD